MNSKLVACAFALSLTGVVNAQTRVHTVEAAQTLIFPNFDFTQYPNEVAIDGDFAIVTNDETTRRVALLYRRSSTGTWQSAGTLLSVDSPGSVGQDDEVKMADGIATIRIGGVLHIFERSGNGYRESPASGTPTGGRGISISNGRILAARRSCNHDAALHEKSRTGVWNITGSISGSAGSCASAPLDLEGDVALVVNSTTEIREYRRNGTAKVWPQVGTIRAPEIPFGVTFDSGHPALVGDTAFAGQGHYFRRVGSNWAYRGAVEPLDSARGRNLIDVDARDGKIFSNSSISGAEVIVNPDLYVRNTAGGYDHVASLRPFGVTTATDVSGNRAIVASTDNFDGTHYVQFYELPVPLVAPPAIADDFEARDVSGWSQGPGSQFALASRGAGTVYRQSSVVDKSVATLTASDWANAQTIEAEITPTFFACADCWVGLAVRYVDANNHYYVTLRNSGRIELKRMVDGVFTTLRSSVEPVQPGQSYRLRLAVNGSRITATLAGRVELIADDRAIPRGRAALLTYRARADFDNVYAGSTESFSIAEKDFSGLSNGQEFAVIGGTWSPVEQSGYPDLAFGQLSTSGDARAFVGKPTNDQVIEARMRLVEYGPSRSGSWFGLLARWVDARNHYYLTLRSTGTLDIRKQVNGAITVLKSVPFTAVPGRYYDVEFAALGDELHVYIDGRFVAGAIDDDIPRGQYGLATYATAAVWQSFYVRQP